MTNLGSCQPGNRIALSAQADLLVKQQKGFASPRACQQAYATKRDAELKASRISLGFSLLLSCLIVGEGLWAIKLTKQGFAPDKQAASFTRQLVGAGALLGVIAAAQGVSVSFGHEGDSVWLSGGHVQVPVKFLISD